MVSKSCSKIWVAGLCVSEQREGERGEEKSFCSVCCCARYAKNTRSRGRLQGDRRGERGKLRLDCLAKTSERTYNVPIRTKIQ